MVCCCIFSFTHFEENNFEYEFKIDWNWCTNSNFSNFLLNSLNCQVFQISHQRPPSTLTRVWTTIESIRNFPFIMDPKQPLANDESLEAFVTSATVFPVRRHWQMTHCFPSAYWTLTMCLMQHSTGWNMSCWRREEPESVFLVRIGDQLHWK